MNGLELSVAAGNRAELRAAHYNIRKVQENRMINRLTRKSIGITALVALMLACACIISQHAYAADKVYTEGYLKYTISNESITIIEYFGNDKTVTVPSQIAGIPVNTIGKGSFSGTAATKVELPDTITSINEGAIGSGVTVVYNANTSKPETMKPDKDSGDSSADKKDEDKKDQTVSINKGQTVTIKDKTYTVTKGTSGKTLKGTKLKDEDGNEYTVNNKNELVNEDGDVVGEIPSDSYASISSGDVDSDEIDISLDEEETVLPKGVVIAVVLAIIAAVAAGANFLWRRKKAEEEDYEVHSRH